MSMPLSQLILPGGGVKGNFWDEMWALGDQKVFFMTLEARDIRFSKDTDHSRELKRTGVFEEPDVLAKEHFVPQVSGGFN